MDPKKDHYATLGVLPSIDDVALTAVSRSLLKKYHPDVAKGQKTDERAAEIIEAYRVLGNADLRKAYDSARREIKSDGYSWEDLRSVKMRPQSGLLRSLVTVCLLSFGLRSLVTACVLSFLAMGIGPAGTMLADAIKHLSAFNVAGDFNFRLPFSDAANPGRTAVRHVEDQGVRDNGPRNNQVVVVKFGEQGPWRSEIRTASMKVIHVAKSDSDASAAGQSSLAEMAYRHLPGTAGVRPKTEPPSIYARAASR